MNEKWFKFMITLIWLVVTAVFIATGCIAACVSAAMPVFLKILIIGILIVEEIWVTIAWMDGLGG